MKHFRLKFFVNVILLTAVFFSCEEEEKVELPTSALIHYSVADKQVAFTALAHNADTYSWDFGDGQTSTEKDPVHIYSGGGYYTVILSVSGGTGVVSASEDLAIALSPYVLLTGGANAVNGKTWKLTANHSPNDKFANADATLSPEIQPLPIGAFDLLLDMGNAYKDEFTFYYDGTYKHDNTNAGGSSFAALVHQMLTTGGANITNANGQDYGLCLAAYSPETSATFNYTESEDFAVPSVYGPGGILTYTGVSTLSFSGQEFVGFWDVQRKVIVQEIQDKSMRLVMFMNAAPQYYPAATHALVLSFEVVE